MTSSDDGNQQVIPIDDKGQLSEAFNMRIDELNVIDMVFLEGCAKPTIAVLYQDNKDARHIKTYEVVVKEKVGRTGNKGRREDGTCARHPG